MKNQQVNNTLLLVLVLLVGLIPLQIAPPTFVNSIVNDNINLLLVLVIACLVGYYNFGVGLLLSLLVLLLLVRNRRRVSEAFYDEYVSNDSSVSNNVEQNSVANNVVANNVVANNVVANNSVANNVVANNSVANNVVANNVVANNSVANNVSENNSVVQDKHGYDVSGCRFDLNYSSQNESTEGPALSACSTYCPISVGKTGTVFYPLNPR